MLICYFQYVVHAKWFILYWCYQSRHRRQYCKFNNSSIFKYNIGHVHNQNIVARGKKIYPIFKIRIGIMRISPHRDFIKWLKSLSESLANTNYSISIAGLNGLACLALPLGS